MSEASVNPLVGRDVSRARLRSLPFEVVGYSKVELIRLPRDPSFSPLKHNRQLLLRLGWVFEALSLLHWDANGVPTDIALESSTILRLVLIVLHECRGDDLERDFPASLDYRIWRQIALETVIWGFRLLMLSRYEMSIDEEDLITTEIQRAKASWILHEELQSFETFAFDELLPSCVSPCIPHRVDQDCWQDELRRIVETMADRTSPISLTKGFWELHDLISEASILPRSYQGVKAGKQPVGTRDSSLRLILDAFKTSQIHHAETVAADIVKYHLRRLFRNLGISEDEVYILQDARISKRISRTLEAEVKEFRSTFLAPWDNDPIGSWLERANARSPHSVTSEDRPNLSHLDSHGSPFSSKLSTKSAQRSFDADSGLSMDRARDREGEYRRPAVPTSEEKKHGSAEEYRAVITAGENLVSSPNLASGGLPQREISSSEVMPSRDPETNKSSLQEEAIWNARLHLPVSTFIPAGTLSNALPSVEASSQARQRFGAFSPYSSSAEVVFPVSGLETLQPSPTPPPKLPAEDREIPTLAEGSRRSSYSTLHHQHQEIGQPTASELDTSKPRRTSTSMSMRSEKKGRISRLLRGSRQSMSPLPASLRFRFSDCATYIMLWCVSDPDYIVRITEPFRSGQRIRLHIASETATSPVMAVKRSIRHLACTSDLVATVVHVENSRWVYTVRDDLLQPLLPLGEDVPRVLSLAVSPDQRKIALGCGSTIILIRFAEREKGSQHGYVIERASIRAVCSEKNSRAHQLSFTPDSSRLISAVQVPGNGIPHQHQVHTEVWKCARALELESPLGSVTIVVGYSGDAGISSVHSVESSDFARGQKILLTAAVSQQYHSLLSTAPTWRNRYLNVPDHCIIDCVQSWELGTSHYFAMRSGPDKILRVDGRSGVWELVANISTDGSTKGLNLRHECVALGMPKKEIIYSLWRTAGQGLMLKIYLSTRGNWGSAAVELGGLYRQLAGLV